MNDLIRCIDTKTGKEKFMPPNIVKDRQLMATYNLVVQDNDENKKEIEKILSDPKEVVSGLVDDFEDMTDEEIIAEQKRNEEAELLAKTEKPKKTKKLKTE